MILHFFEILSTGQADVVFGKRVARQDPPIAKMLSNLFWSAYRRFVLADIPRGGVDVFAGNRDVVNAVLAIEEPNSSLVAQLFWVGFRRQFVPYERRARVHGKARGTFPAASAHPTDSIFSYSDLPIMVLLWVGVIGMPHQPHRRRRDCGRKTAGLHHGAGLYHARAADHVLRLPDPLRAGDFRAGDIWRALENTKRRPLRFVSRVVEHEREAA